MTEQMNAPKARAAQSMTSEAHQTAAREGTGPKVGGRYACHSKLTGRQFEVVVLEIRQGSAYVRDDSTEETYLWNPQHWQQNVLHLM